MDVCNVAFAFTEVSIKWFSSIWYIFWHPFDGVPPSVVWYLEGGAKHAILRFVYCVSFFFADFIGRLNRHGHATYAGSSGFPNVPW